MLLSPGTQLGQYEVIESVGVGGMGEVYRARDTKLDRDVAIKVLPEEFSQDKERVARFEREAKLLAQLNHPNIATLYGLEKHEGQQFLVMELVEGETLAERIARGPIPLDEALSLLIQIAEGLEAAHEKGIIHRDLKPANVKITPEGQVKILDFGLAKAFATDPNVSVETSQSPTRLRQGFGEAGTQLGAIMGTASYMSPEQARGKPVDKRTDVWAFACCLFEALTGRKTFAGETASDIVGAVLRDEPQWNALAVDTPTIIRRLLKRCLVKDRRERVPDIGVARFEIKEAMTGSGTDLAAVRTVARSPMWQRLAPYVATAAAAGLIVWAASPQESSAPPFPARSMISLADGVELVGGNNSSLALSPDGQLLVYAATRDGNSLLFSRPLKSFEASPIPGTEGATSPFFSPDGQWVGFFTGERLKKVSLDAGLASVICNATGTGRASWAPDNTIIFSTGSSGLLSVSADGGEPEILTTPDRDSGDIWHMDPHILPDGENVLFTISMGADSRVGLLSLSSREWVVLELGSAQGVRYAPSGHLIYGRAGGLSAAAFDVEQLKVVGSSVPVVGNVSTSSLFGMGDCVLSDNGTLVYAPERRKNELVWVDRQGVTTPLLDAPGVYLAPSISPDARRLAVAVLDPSVARRSLWIYDLGRATLTRLTSDDSDATDPVWSPDGTRIAYGSRVADVTFNVFVKTVDGAAEAIQLTSAPNAVPVSWSPDGENIIYMGASAGVHIVSNDPGNPAEPLLTGHDQRNGTLSPDGRWLAFSSFESGRVEVYVRPYPALDRSFLVSTAGGAEPRWSGNGRELFYREGDKMMAVDVRLERDFSASQPRVLFEGPFATDPVGGDGINYDVTPDGERFVMVRETERTPQLYMVLNWFEELKRVAPRAQ